MSHPFTWIVGVSCLFSIIVGIILTVKEEHANGRQIFNLRCVGGLQFWRIGRFGGSCYWSRSAIPCNLVGLFLAMMVSFPTSIGTVYLIATYVKVPIHVVTFLSADLPRDGMSRFLNVKELAQ